MVVTFPLRISILLVLSIHDSMNYVLFLIENELFLIKKEKKGKLTKCTFLFLWPSPITVFFFLVFHKAYHGNLEVIMW